MRVRMEKERFSLVSNEESLEQMGLENGKGEDCLHVKVTNNREWKGSRLKAGVERGSQN